ncbi:MAG: hypothetical protein V4719_02870 [Planctomycetota bacterium]
MKHHPQLYNQDGVKIVLGPELGRGGEGVVFEVVGQPSVVAKVYLNPPAARKAEKLRSMVRAAIPELLGVAAWPTATLHSWPGGDVLGLLMARVSNHEEVHKLYSPAHRTQIFPGADWTFLIRTACNCAIAFDTLHQRGHIIGDVNQSNVLVSNKATVVLIDCDSFEITSAGQHFPCEVGVPLYTPPELQGQSFRGVNRTVNHDRFGLAVLIFHLLFMGRHPFSGRYLGKGDMPLERAIQEFRFAFGNAAASLQVAPPPNSLTMAAIPNTIRALFHRAFDVTSKSPGARPSAAEWMGELTSFERQLSQCSLEPNHRYSSHLTTCPWCALIIGGGPTFFLSVTANSLPVAGQSTFEIHVFWASVERTSRLKLSYSRPAIFSQTSIRPAALPDSAIVPEKVPFERLPFQPIALWITIISIPFAFSAVTLPFAVAIFVTFAIFWMACEVLAIQQNKERNSEREAVREVLDSEHHRRRDVLEKIRDQITKVEARILGSIQDIESSRIRMLEDLNKLRVKYEKLDGDRKAERLSLEKAKEQIQLQQFLQKHFISQAKLPGIGAVRQAQLESFGIETAAHISKQALSFVPGFGPKMIEVLVEWRSSIARQFHFNVSVGVPQSLIIDLERKYVSIRRDIETRLKLGLSELNSLHSKAESQMRPFRKTIEVLVHEFAQAESDFTLSDSARFACDN